MRKLFPQGGAPARVHLTPLEVLFGVVSILSFVGLGFLATSSTPSSPSEQRVQAAVSKMDTKLSHLKNKGAIAGFSCEKSSCLVVFSDRSESVVSFSVTSPPLGVSGPSPESSSMIVSVDGKPVPSDFDVSAFVHAHKEIGSSLPVKK